MARANGSASGLQEPRCHPKRWDRSVYGSAIVQDRCPDLVPCSPPNSCLGNNTCAVGYQWIVERCQAARSSTAPNYCETDRDCDPNPRRECHAESGALLSLCEEGVNGSGRQCRQSYSMCIMHSWHHYRPDGISRNAQIILWPAGLIIAAGVFAMIGGYILGRRKFNMAFLSIGIDYLVLALFAGSNIR